MIKVTCAKRKKLKWPGRRTRFASSRRFHFPQNRFATFSLASSSSQISQPMLGRSAWFCQVPVQVNKPMKSSTSLQIFPGTKQFVCCYIWQNCRGVLMYSPMPRFNQCFQDWAAVWVINNLFLQWIDCKSFICFPRNCKEKNQYEPANTHSNKQPTTDPITSPMLLLLVDNEMDHIEREFKFSNLDRACN